MSEAKTRPRDAYTFLTHLFGRGLEDERYAVERFRSMDDGEWPSQDEARDRLPESRPADCGPRGMRSSSARP